MISQEEFAKMVLHEFDVVKSEIAEGRADIALLEQKVTTHLTHEQSKAAKAVKIKLAIFGTLTAVGTTLLNFFIHQ